MDPKAVMKVVGDRPKVIIGGPPCQPFSVAGKQGAMKDPLGTLYRDYVKHVKILKPDIIILENVYGLAQVKSANMISKIHRSFEEIGYEVTHRELLSADFGTPQKRRRLFFVAAKELQNFSFSDPTHMESANLLGIPTYNGAGNSFSHLPKPHFANSKKP